MKKESTREKILEAAAELIHRQGFNHTGIQEILGVAGVPKGSFYFYFKSKEDLGLALIHRYGEGIETRARSCFTDALRPPLERLRSFFQSAHAHLKADGCQKGCPIGNLCQEMSDLSAVFRQKLEAVMASVAREVAGLLLRAREAGELPAHLDPEDTARFILSSWQGALLIMKVEKSVEPLHRFERFIFGEILSGKKSDSASSGSGKRTPPLAVRS